MSTIKPPDGSPATGRTGPALGPDAERGAERAGPSFRETLAGPSAAPPAGEPPPAGVTAASGAAGSALAEAVRAGALTPEQAIDQLVESAVAGVAGSLSDAQRAELRAVLSEAVQSDPALRELRDAISP